MSYAPIHDYAGKDALSTGNPDKLVKGADLTDDFTAIAAALPESGTADGVMAYWTGVAWESTDEVKYVQDSNPINDELLVTLNARLRANNVFGSTNSNNHFFFGDTYIGYSETTPDNSDQELGTLFLGRGALVGRDLPVGTASIMMEGNIIGSLGNPVFADHAVNKATLDATTGALASSIAVALNEAVDFDTFKARLGDALQKMNEGLLHPPVYDPRYTRRAEEHS